MSSAAPTTTAPEVVTDERGGFTERELVLGVVGLLVAAHLVLRAWMVWPSWFYVDDHALLGEAAAGGLDPHALLEPYAGQFMPLGRLVAWAVDAAGPLSWPAAAASLLVMVALADAALVWMLLELFGARRGVLLPLAAYLGSAVLLPATLWWAAALNQLPLQAVLCAAVAAWVRHLRTGRRWWWVVTVAVVGVGLLAYVKAVLVVGVLAWLTLAHFTSGRPLARVRDAARSHALPAAVLVAGGVAFVAWYIRAVPSIVTAGDPGTPVAGDLARTMIGQALPTGLLGGPWRWQSLAPPTSLADPPALAVAASWVVLLAVAVVLASRRRRTGRVWGLLVAYVVGAYLLVLTTRAPLVGGVVGLEYRYLTDVVPVACLCLGLATMRVRGAVEPTEARPGRPTSGWARLPLVAAGLLLVSGLVSQVGYARAWHDDFPAQAWFDRVRGDLAGQGRVDLADAPVPEQVVPASVAPWDTLGRLLPQAGLDVAFPPVSTRLGHVDGFGHLTQAVVTPVVAGEPGPVPACGHRLDADDPTTTIALDRPVPAGVYWLRLPYLTSAADTLRVTAGEASGEAQVGRGLGSVFVDLAAGADEVTVTVEGDATVCLDDLVAGPLAPGPAW
ncbi:hypothetical protein [Nocardioides litoris]|uniref:hypothetical protein n=1 Tax=Nocardioides litoris TaxID=1926648 RepID=UPI0014773E5D|nr:hypothetical protein [Nocardioides litoris]